MFDMVTGQNHNNYSSVSKSLCECNSFVINSLLFSYCRPTGAFSKSRPILPCRISACHARDLWCWLVNYFDLCATRCSPDIRRAFGNRVELAILLGQLLGERPAGGLRRNGGAILAQTAHHEDQISEIDILARLTALS